MQSNGDYSKREPFRIPESAGAIRHGWFITAAGPDATAYPSEGDTPNVYYARKVRNPTYTQAVGNQSVTYETTSEYAFICNLHPETYIEEGSLLKCWHENGRWWTIDKTAPGFLWVGSALSTSGGGPYRLAAYNPATGTVKQTKQTSGSTGANRFVRFGGDGTLWTQGNESTAGNAFSRFSPSGALLGTVSTNVGLDPAFDASGNFYGFVTGTGIVKYSPSGTLIGTVVSNTTSSGGYLAIDASGNIHFRDGDASGSGLTKYDSSGTPLWNVALAGTPFGQWANICLDASGNIYASGKSWDSSGTLRWTAPSGYDQNFEACQIAADGSLYVTRPGTLRKLNPATGALIWKAEASKVTGYFSGTDEPSAAFAIPGLCCNGDAIYTACQRSSGAGNEPTVRRFDPDGNEAWALDTERPCWSVGIAPGIPVLFQ